MSAAEEKEHIGHVLRKKRLEQPIHQRIAGMTDRIAELSEGYPLYAEEYVAMLEDLFGSAKDDSAPDRLPAPPTIDDLMNDRLFRLGPDERAVIQRAAVVGKQFHVADVDALAPDHGRQRVERALELLASRELALGDHEHAVATLVLDEHDLAAAVAAPRRTLGQAQPCLLVQGAEQLGLAQEVGHLPGAQRHRAHSAARACSTVRGSACLTLPP